jgi:hypothetical protein
MDLPDRHAVFRKAVLDLSDEPTPVNIRRYLAASRLLDADAAGRRAKRRRPGGGGRTIELPARLPSRRNAA